MTQAGRIFSVCAGLLLLIAATASAQIVDSTLWALSPGDRVLAIAPAGDTVYIGGSFLYVGPPTGGGVPVDRATAKPVTPYPRIVGRVEAVVADGEGGWFVGGSFTHVGSQPRRNLAHILADGNVSSWAPNPNLEVWALALSGRTLYVGGDFDSLGGQPRLRLGAVDITDDDALSWRCDADGRPSAILIVGTTVYLGGWFTSVAGQARSYVAAVDATTGEPMPLQVSLDDRVCALAVRDTTLYIGGYFTAANGVSRTGLVAVDGTSGVVLPWDAQLTRTPINTRDGGPHVNALLVAGDSIFVAGSFTRLGGQARRGLAQLDLTTALATGFDARPRRLSTFGPDLWGLLLSGDTLFVAGAFDTLGGSPPEAGRHAAALDARTGWRLAWDPDANDFIFALALQRGVIFVGGWFTSVGDWVLRRGLASIDTRTGRVTDWDPAPSDYVVSLLFQGGKVYAGGYFSTVGGQARSGLASLDPVTGLATAWNPSPNSSVWTIQPLGPDLIVGGLFSTIGGRSRRGIAVLDTVTGIATAWNANLLGEAYDIAVSDTAIYVGGDFSSVAGQSRLSLAALDPRTGALLPWDPGTDGTVQEVRTLDGVIFVGGGFEMAGGLSRAFVAAIDGAGRATDWNLGLYGPAPHVAVRALATADSTVFIGGYFSGLSGVPREYFAAVDARTGHVREEFPTIDGNVWAIETDRGSVYVGGGFGRAGAHPQSNFVAIRPARSPEPPPTPGFPSLTVAPNPARDATTIRYSLAGPMQVSLTLFDLQGRAVSRPLVRALQSAGPQQVQLSTTGLRAGCYLYRLDMGRMSATRKLVVVK